MTYRQRSHFTGKDTPEVLASKLNQELKALERAHVSGATVLVAGGGARTVGSGGGTGPVPTNAIIQVADIASRDAYTGPRYEGMLCYVLADDITYQLVGGIANTNWIAFLYWTQARFDAAFAAKTTTDLAEGTNLYYTATRFNSAFAAKSTTDLAEGTNLYYTAARFNSAFAAKSTTDLAEGTNLYYTAARFNTAFAGKSTTDLAEGTNLYYTAARFNTAFSGKSTTDLAEGTNLYYTDARARGVLSVSDPLTYNSTTGAFGFSYNATNLKLSTGALNTIQDITTSSNVQFGNGIFSGYLQAVGVNLFDRATNGDVLEIRHTGAADVANDLVLESYFNNDAAALISFSSVVFASTAITAGAERGRIQFKNLTAGALVVPLTLSGANSTFAGNVGIAPTTGVVNDILLAVQITGVNQGFWFQNSGNPVVGMNLLGRDATPTTNVAISTAGTIVLASTITAVGANEFQVAASGDALRLRNTAAYSTANTVSLTAFMHRDDGAYQYFGQIQFKSNVVTTGTEQGYMLFQNRSAGAWVAALSLLGGDVSAYNTLYVATSIGVGAFGAATPSSALHLLGRVALRIGNSDADGEFTTITQYDTGVVIFSSQGTTDAGNGYGYIKFRTNGSKTTTVGNGGFRFEHSDGTEYMRIRADGNVGIGTTTPGSLLHISVDRADTTLWSGAADLQLAQRNTTNNTWTGIQFNATGGTVGAGIGVIFYDQTNHYAKMVFSTRSSTAWNLNNLVLYNGNVGIADATPAVRLAISQAAATGDAITLTSTATGDVNSYISYSGYLKNDAAALKQFAQIKLASPTVTGGSEVGRIDFLTMSAGTLTLAFRISDINSIAQGTFQVNSTTELKSTLFIRGDIRARNKADSAWLTVFARDTTGSEIVYNGYYLGHIDCTEYRVAATKVVGARVTGWTTPTGTATRANAGFDTSTITLPQLAQAVKALVDDLLAHGLIGA